MMMNQILQRYSALFFVVVAVLAARPAQAQVGLAAGLTYDNLGDIEVSSARATFESATGYHVGVFVDLAAGPLAIRPGVFYRHLGNMDLGGSLIIDDVSETFDISIIEAPIDLRFRLGVTPLISPYIMAGPVIRFAATDNELFEDNLENFSLAADVGFGIEVKLGAVKLFPELRYAFGITRFLKEDIVINNITITPDDEARLNTFMIRLGVGF
jgi:hypothetical protein